MGFALFVGCFLVAFSVPVSVFVLLIAKKPTLVVTTIASSFFWLVSLVVSSIIWYIALQGMSWAMVPVSVVITELGRAVFIKLYAKAERSFSVVSTNAIAFPLTDFYSALAAGVGYSLIHCLLMYSVILSNALGPGTFFADTCPHFSTFVVTAWLSFSFGILHILLMIIAFDAFRRRSIVKCVILCLLHMAAACSVLNFMLDDGCIIGTGLAFVITCLAGLFTMYIVNQPTYKSRKRAF